MEQGEEGNREECLEGGCDVFCSSEVLITHDCNAKSFKVEMVCASLESSLYWCGEVDFSLRALFVPAGMRSIRARPFESVDEAVRSAAYNKNLAIAAKGPATPSGTAHIP